MTLELEPLQLADAELELVLISREPGDPLRSRVPAYNFEMRVGGERVGTISLRLGHTEFIEKYAGHIGYGVDLAHRGHHYAARACKLLFPIAKQHGFHVLWITCNPENVASRRTCERAGGQLIDIVDLPPDTEMYREGERQKCRYRVVL
jgi:tagatose 1,6-diphosphate aldolase